LSTFSNLRQHLKTGQKTHEIKTSEIYNLHDPKKRS
jgi:hypothetical protein